MGKLDRHPPDSAGGTSDQYALAEHQAPIASARSAVSPAVGRVAAFVFFRPCLSQVMTRAESSRDAPESMTV